MRPILLDTNAYVAFKRGEASAVDILRSVETIAMSPIVIGELLGGFECGNRSRKNREELQEFLLSPRIVMLSLTADTAHFYAKIYADLRSKGKSIPTNDLWIAAQGLENGCLLYTMDSHFQVVEGLLTGSFLSEFIVY
ncbi:MAG: type II toxin-antitoxin system VapC family toxin [Chlamydiia bacterium]|nr:type II toxin-antitoxin system VapC family toxin [Chlamydiia bacterium]